jgi:hypothetical protein
VTARISAIRGDQSHPVISLDNGQTWTLLDAGESRLSEGISVTIRPAALGSYLMTGAGLAQSHRVRRLK